MPNGCSAKPSFPSTVFLAIRYRASRQLYHVSHFGSPDAMGAVIKSETKLPPADLIAVLGSIRKRFMTRQSTLTLLTWKA